jgi:hypothetical protein
MTAAQRLAYTEKALAGPLSETRRQALEAKATEYRQSLAGHCARCGRSIQGAGPLGPECAKVAA